MTNYGKLNDMFAIQYEFDQRIIRERNIDKTMDEWVMATTVAMEDEISELRNEINWKHWKNEKSVNMDRVRSEVTDLWAFLISLSIHVGMDSTDVYNEYLAKMQENHARQDGTSTKEGYAVDDPFDGIMGIPPEEYDRTGSYRQPELDFENGGVK
ncbi:dUTPase [Bacillus wiedmannii]|nr:dUTPase [Bacillus wiedmannii]